VAVTGYVRMEGGSGDEFVGLLEEKSKGKVKHGDVILMVIHPTVNSNGERPQKNVSPKICNIKKGDFDPISVLWECVNSLVCTLSTKAHPHAPDPGP
jgi:hypothetical protein